VLSGYLITGSRLANSLGRYLWNRVLRLYPGYLVCLLSVVVLFAPFGYYRQHHTLRGYVGAHPSPLRYVVTNLGLKLQTIWVSATPVGNHRPWAGSLWTLWFEFLCYLAVGAVACLAIFRRNALLCGVLLVLASVASIEQAQITAATHSSELYQLCRLLPLFLGGSWCYLVRDRIPCRWELAALATGFLVVWPIVGGYRWMVLCGVPMAYLLLYLGAIVPIRIGRRNDISYGMYMYGFPVEQAMRYAQWSSQTLYAVCSVAATVPFAAASWHWIEHPMMRWGRNLGRPQVAPAGDRQRPREDEKIVALAN
jgi:peptidoglycan/LPS O-acetylase OafA/YrhL